MHPGIGPWQSHRSSIKLQCGLKQVGHEFIQTLTLVPQTLFMHVASMQLGGAGQSLAVVQHPGMGV